MLEDVRHARIVLGRRAEGDAEGLVLLGAGEPDEVRPVLLVRHPHEPRADVRQLIDRPDDKTLQTVARLQGHARQLGRRTRTSDKTHRHQHQFPSHRTASLIHSSNRISFSTFTLTLPLMSAADAPTSRL